MVLLVKNGVFGDKLEEIIHQYRIPNETIAFEWATYPDLGQIQSTLQGNPHMAWVAMVYHEASAGMINPVGEVGELCVRYGKKYFVDCVWAAGVSPSMCGKIILILQPRWGVNVSVPFQDLLLLPKKPTERTYGSPVQEYFS